MYIYIFDKGAEYDEAAAAMSVCVAATRVDDVRFVESSSSSKFALKEEVLLHIGGVESVDMVSTEIIGGLRSVGLYTHIHKRAPKDIH